jgi:hypothetical protein
MVAWLYDKYPNLLPVYGKVPPDKGLHAGKRLLSKRVKRIYIDIWQIQWHYKNSSIFEIFIVY